MKILIVDDDVNILRLYREEFLEEGYDVITAGNGKEALRLFDEQQPDLVSLDILIPDIDGLQLLRKMKRKRPGLPIIMTTAYDYKDDYAEWASDSYIMKSSDTNELKETVRALIKKAGPAKQREKNKGPDKR